MKISVVGLGKLGFPMAYFLRSKFEVNAFDKNAASRKLIKKNPINYLPHENNIKKYLNKSLNICNSIEESLQNTNIVFITVPTPSLKNGKFTNKFLIAVLTKISKYIKNNKIKKPYLININSTVSPGSFDNELIPFMTKNGLKINYDYDFIYNPYFVALGDVINNLEKPDFILLGSSSKDSSKKIQTIYKKIYKKVNFKSMTLREGELVKLLVNCYVASKISFTNYVKNISENTGSISVSTILNAIGTDKRIGNNFLRPGGPFLGPCLPRDIVALTKFSKDIKINTLYPESAKKINKITLENLLNVVGYLKRKKIKSIGFTGLAYKPNTDFFEESIAYKLMKKAKKIGIKIYFFDKYIKNTNLKFNRVDSVKSLFKNSNVVFLSYEDKYIIKQKKNFQKKVLIWDIFNYIEFKNIKKFSNQKELSKFF